MNDTSDKFIVDDQMIESRLNVLKAEEEMLYTNSGIAPHPHIAWEHAFIATIKDLKQQLLDSGTTR